MHVESVLNGLRASIEHQRMLAGDDPAVDDAVGSLLDALDPAVRLAALELAQQAAIEVGAQLSEHRVDVVLVDGDPNLRLAEVASQQSGEHPNEDLDARITLRLPPSLKRLIEDAANSDGGSVNAWVVDTLSKRATRSEPSGRRVTESFDL